MFEKYFKLKENGTNIRTEVIAGITTFLTMAYIIFVNPQILADAGMDRGAVFVATCIACAAGSLIAWSRAYSARIVRDCVRARDSARVWSHCSRVSIFR